MIIIAGLGNPGLKYRKTRHNAGFEVIDILAKRHDIAVKKKARMSIYGEGTICGEKVLLVKPLTFMNKSGESLIDWINYYKIDVKEKLIVISDDVTLDPGFVRIRRKGSAGGHNGLKNIINHTGTEDFKRVRVGVGKLPAGEDMIRHVLGRMNRSERALFEKGVESAAGAVDMIVKGDLEGAMNTYNKKK